jgi:hypothetical protein
MAGIPRPRLAYGSADGNVALPLGSIGRDWHANERLLDAADSNGSLDPSSCVVITDDIEALFDAFAAGLRADYGRLPVSGFPRITRPPPAEEQRQPNRVKPGRPERQLETSLRPEAVFSHAVTVGAVIRQPLADMFWGDRHGQLEDPFGHRWNIVQHLRDVPHDEVVAAAQAFS